MGKTASTDISVGTWRLTPVGFAGELTEKPSLGDFGEAVDYVTRVAGASNWWLGELGLHAEEWDKEEPGSSYQDLFAEKTAHLGEREVQFCIAVAKGVAYRTRVRELSWSHHRAVAPLTARDQKRWLRKASPREGENKPRLSVAELRKAIREERLAREREANPLPAGTFRVIYADPPWKYNDERTGTVEAGAAIAQYPLLTTEELCELHDADGRRVQDIAQTDAVLFLWATAPMLPDALKVLEAWGFSYKAQYVWLKQRGYNGHYNDVRHELLLIGTRGSCVPDIDTLQPSDVSIERTAHSKKPHEFYDIIEAMYSAGPYIELFARSTREDWNSWGNQTGTNDTTAT